MSLVLELEQDGRKAGHVCNRDYRRGPNCPLIVRRTSEDVLSGTVFGILRRLRPSLWLRPLLNHAFGTRRFVTSSMRGLTLSFWEPVAPPAMLANREGMTEADVVIRFGNTVIFIEAKYLSGLATRTKHDKTRDQLIRLLDVAYQSVVAEQFYPRAPYILVIGVPVVEPPLVTKYRDPTQISEGLGHHRRYPDHERMAALLAGRVGYASWTDLASVLTAAMPKAHHLERALLGDVADFVATRVAVANLTRNQRQQMLLSVVASNDEGDNGSR